MNRVLIPRLDVLPMGPITRIAVLSTDLMVYQSVPNLHEFAFYDHLIEITSPLRLDFKDDLP